MKLKYPSPNLDFLEKPSPFTEVQHEMAMDIICSTLMGISAVLFYKQPDLVSGAIAYLNLVCLAYRDEILDKLL